MPDIELTADQRDRLRDLQRQLEAKMASQYATVQAGDAVAYLLDQYATEGEVALDGGPKPVGDDAETTSSAAPDDDGGVANPASSSSSSSSSSGGFPSGPMTLLADHEGAWREGSGEARYEVELPDGSVEGARTRGDVRALLFKHYR